jgi:hypothetical protein
VAPRGRILLVLGFAIRDGKIVEIDVVADPERLGPPRDKARHDLELADRPTVETNSLESRFGRCGVRHGVRDAADQESKYHAHDNGYEESLNKIPRG